jgi:hypothetical protein
MSVPTISSAVHDATRTSTRPAAGWPASGTSADSTSASRISAVMISAALARLEIRIFFEELLRRVSALRLVDGAEPVEMPNAFVYGLREARMELDFVS